MISSYDNCYEDDCNSILSYYQDRINYELDISDDWKDDGLESKIADE